MKNRFNRLRVCVFIFGLPVFANSTGMITITKITTTNTQAILSYTAPDSDACTVAVSQNQNYTPLANDVDPTKFAGSNLDNRVGSITRGNQRVFIIGKRTADLALDGNRYSRALQAVTTYYYSVTCPSTGDVLTGSLQTLTLATGNTYADAAPADRANPGSYAWPTLSYSDRTQQIVDPQTGILLRRVSMPQDRNVTQNNQMFAMARSQTWNDPDAVLANTDGGGAATINGNNTGNLLILPQNNGYFGYISFFKGLHENNLATLNWFQVTLTGMTSNTLCNSASMDDCKIVACLTIDGVSCYNGSQQFEQALTSSPASYKFGTAGTAIDLWQQAGYRPPNGTEIATRVGTVNCNGSTAVTYTGGDFFGSHWNPGSTITINNTDYSIASIASETSLTTTTPCTSGANLPYQGTNFGVLVHKKTTSADTISLQYAQVNYQTGTFPQWNDSGEYNICGPTPVLGGDGTFGYNCSLENNGPLYWVDGTSGETHMIARNMGAGCGTFDAVIFDTVNPDVFYCGGTQTVQPVKVQYFGNHLEPLNTLYPGHFEESENLPNCNSGTNPTNQPCLVFTTLTGTSTMGALTTAFDPTFQADRFPQFYLVGIENNVMVFRVWRGPYGSIGWTVIFDPSAVTNGQPGNAGCVGGGLPGCVIGALPSWNRTNSRWCTLKSNDPLYYPGWLALDTYLWGAPSDTSPGVGPYISTVTDGTAFQTGVGVPGGLSACPPNQYGILGNQCTTAVVDGEPRDPSPCTASPSVCNGAVETGLAGELGKAQVGDWFTLGPANSNEEVMILLEKGGPTAAAWTFGRGINGTLVSSLANPALYTFCNADPNPLRLTVGNGELFWNYALDPHGNNVSGQTLLGDYNSIGAHGYTQNLGQAIAWTEDPRCISGAGYQCYETRSYANGIPAYVDSGAVNVMQLNPFFNGKFGPADADYVQSHPSGPGFSADATAANYFFDGRPMNGTWLSGSGNGNGASPAQLVAGQLYKFTAAQMPNMDRKFMQTFASTGYKPLVDVSGPTQGNAITPGAADAYKYCVALKAGECNFGSSAGDVFVNAPFVSYPYCNYQGQASGMPDQFDLCIGNNAMVYNSVMQVGKSWVDNTGLYQRPLTKAFNLGRLESVFWNVHPVANGNVVLVDTNYAQNVGDMVFAAVIPPVPQPDSVGRNAYIPVMVNVPAQPNLHVANAYVEFGYSEYGGSPFFYCSSRQEVCAVGPATNPSTIDPVNPYYYVTAEAASLTGTPCANGCSIALPAISQRVLYARVVYRNAANQIVARGGLAVEALP